MNKKLKNFLSLNFCEINLNLNTIVLFGSFFFYIISTLYACLVFVQFSIFDILYVAIFFFFILSLLCSIFLADIFKCKFQINKFNIFFILIISGYLLIILSSEDPAWYDYFRTFPLFEVENNRGWHMDSAFHVSIIRSYNLFGYPSISQHGTPFLSYHTLSHLIDSIGVFVTGVDAWDSYGLFFHFKRVLLIITILIFIAVVCARSKFYIFLLSVIIILPSIIGDWHAVGSHGLWFSSLILIISAPLVLNIISKKNNKLSDFIILFFIIICISLAKISHGAILLILISTILFFNNIKNLYCYIFFFCVGLFLITFAYFFSLHQNIFSSFKFNIVNLLDFLTFKNTNYFLKEIYLQIFLIAAVVFFYNSKFATNLFIAAIFSLLILSLISIQEIFTTSSVYYFNYALQIILFIIIYQLVINLPQLKKRSIFLGKIQLNNKLNNFFVIIIMLLSLANTRLKFSKQKTISYFTSQPFSQINHHDPELKVSLSKIFTNRNYINFEKYERPLHSFKKKLTEFMITHNLHSKNSLLFIPKNIFESEMSKFEGTSWARGHLIYAVTGVPLYKGLETLKYSSYGIKDYTSEALTQYKDDFRIINACKLNKDIIIVDDFVRKKFSFKKC
jgi:hypothetical protein